MSARPPAGFGGSKPAGASPPRQTPPAPAPARPPPFTPAAPRAPTDATRAARARVGVASIVAELAKSRARVAALEAEVEKLRAGPPPPPATPTTTITLRYASGWRDVYAHYSADGGPWTAPPGAKLQPGGDADGGDRLLTVPAARLEFVLTDGFAWDTPDPYGAKGKGGKNYIIQGPGAWRLKSGRLTRLDGEE